MNFGYHNGSQEYYYTLHWWIASQSIANNTTTIGYDIYTSWASNRYIYVYGASCSLNGSNIWGGETGNSYGGNKKSGSITVSHDANGTKTMSASGGATIYSASNYQSNSASWTLTTIARQANILSAENFTDEGNPKITYNNSAGNSVTTLQAGIYNTSGNTEYASYRNINKTGTLSYTFNLTDIERNKLRNAMPNSNSLAVRFYIRTIIGGNTYLSYLQKTCTLVNGNPIFTDFTYKDTNTNITAITGNNQVLVKDLSTLQIEIPSDNKMTAIKGATAKNYTITIENKNVTQNYNDSDLSIDVGTILNSGTKTLGVRAYDSRNNSTLVFKDIMIYDYSKPIINASAIRLNNWENITYLNISGSYTRITINNEEKNSLNTVQYRYKEEHGEWTEWIDTVFEVIDSDYVCTEIMLDLDNRKKFEIEIKAIDNLQTSTIIKTVDIGEAIFFISSNKKTCYINGKPILDYEIVEEW